MTPDTPLSWDSIKELGPVVLVALLGGVVAYFRKVREGAARPFNFTEFIGEMVTSAAAGVFFYWICRYYDLNGWLTAAIIGIAGHMGSRAIFMLEKWFEEKFHNFKEKP